MCVVIAAEDRSEWRLETKLSMKDTSRRKERGVDAVEVEEEEEGGARRVRRGRRGMRRIPGTRRFESTAV